MDTGELSLTSVHVILRYTTFLWKVVKVILLYHFSWVFSHLGDTPLGKPLRMLSERFPRGKTHPE